MLRNESSGLRHRNESRGCVYSRKMLRSRVPLVTREPVGSSFVPRPFLARRWWSDQRSTRRIDRRSRAYPVQRCGLEFSRRMWPFTRRLIVLGRRRLMVASFSTCGAKAAAFRAVILGAPASGKGTISSRIVQQFAIAHISSGDRLRFHVSNGTDVGKQVKKYLDSGSLVPDDIMLSLIGKEIDALGNQNWLLDGFPRTLTQAESLQKVHPANLVVNLIVPTSVILDRVKSRRVHLPSGRVYNLGFNDPKVPGKDDVTGEPLSQREDDKPEVVQKRLSDYSTKTEPVITFYREIGILRDFKGSTSDEMWPDIRKCISEFL